MTSEAKQPTIIGNTPEIVALKSLVAKLAVKDFHLMVLGETGTGKEVVAENLHRQSGRSGKLVAENCGAIPESLFESVVFGHERGAFSGADRRKEGLVHDANHGTLFLDEGHLLTLKNQGKLLRFLEDGTFRRLGATRTEKVNVRVIMATNCDIEKLVREGKFRKDLYYRLAVHVVRLPPVRDRDPGDIELLVRHFIGVKPHLRGMVIPPEVMGELKRFHWPGNVRQIRSVLEALSVDDEVRLEDVRRVLAAQPDFEQADPPPSQPSRVESKKPQSDTRSLILTWLQQSEVLRSRELAELCDRSRSTIWRHLRVLQDENLVVPIGNGPSRRYALASKAPAVMPAKPPMERKSLAMQLVHEHGTLRRHQLMRLTHVSARTASRDLAALVRDDVLRRIGRGRAAHYVVVEQERLPLAA